MSFSYEPALFNDATQGAYVGSTRGIRWQIRMLSHDTNSARAFMQDEEIDWVQTQEANVYMMAARVLDTIIASVGSVKSKRISEFGITYDVGQLRSLGADYRARGATYQMPYAGGISIVDKQIQENDPDAVKPAIKKDLHDNPAAPRGATAGVDPLTVL